jgi:tetratricopeptide (TPR) repeat protein
MSNVPEWKYRAFLSYSHADDAIARWLHRSLESFVIARDLIGRSTPMGVIPKTLKPIFRDREEFKAGETLSAQTLAALDGSMSLILLCSPESAKSHYVNEEVRLFRARYPDRLVIPVIAAGEPGNDEKECFPPALRFELHEDGTVSSMPSAVVLAADARPERDGRDMVIAKLVASLLGLGNDDIYRRAKRAQVRKLRQVIISVAMLALVFLGISIAALVGWRRAEQNFATAKLGVDILVSDIAQSLRHQQGLRTVQTILGTAEQALARLIATSGENEALLSSRGKMLLEMADTYETLGDAFAQEEAARKSLAIRKRLADALPSDIGRQADLWIAYERLGGALAAQRRYEEAQQSFLKGLAVADAALRNDPTSLLALRNSAILQEKVGDTLLGTGDRQAALARYRTSNDTYLRLTQLQAQNLEFKRDRWVGLIKIGDVLLALGRTDESVEIFRSALELAQQLTGTNVESTQYQADQGTSYGALADALVATNDLEGALQSYRAKRDIFRQLTSNVDPKNALWIRELAVAFSGIGNVQTRLAWISTERN